MTDNIAAQLKREQEYTTTSVEKTLDNLVESMSSKHSEVALTIKNEMFSYIRANFDTLYPKRSKSPAKVVVDFLGQDAFSAIVAEEIIEKGLAQATRQELFRSIADRMLHSNLERLLKTQMTEAQVKTFNKAIETSQSELSTFNKFLERSDVKQDITEKDCILLVTTFCLNVLEMSDLFDVETDGIACFTVQLSEKAEKRVENIAALRAKYSVRFKPMISKPREWTGIFGGGYYTKGSLEYPLIKRVTADDTIYVKVVESNPDFHKFLTGVNAIQGTAFRINKEVYNLINTIRNSDDNRFDVYSKKYVADLKDSDASKNRIVENAMETADDLIDAPFWMTYDADFRGRIYCKCDDLTPQGTDLQKALLLFNGEVALGDKGHDWLKIQAANCYAADALDKAPMVQRIAWVDDNMETIRRIAKADIHDPEFVQVMNDADSPLLLFAAACELVRIEGLSEEEIREFKSSIPISIDGSNNGLQHYAGILRSKVLAEKVNLHKLDESAQPSDVYMLVAEGCIEYVKKTKVKAIHAALKTSMIIKQKTVKEVTQAFTNAIRTVQRKTVKRPTMTQAYAVTQQGIKNQLRDDALPKYKKLSDDAKRFFPIIMHHVFEEGLAIHCAAASKGMDFLKNTAKAVGGEFHWTTPSGFTVRQNYKKVKNYKTDSIIAKKRVTVRFKEKLNEVSVDKQKSSIAPNYIHSHDSAHMLLTVNDLINNDENFNSSFLMIHDSFGTFAGQAEALSVQTRKTFVDMYKNNPFEKLQREALAQGAEDVPELPETDKDDLFDINDVEEALYFFC